MHPYSISTYSLALTLLGLSLAQPVSSNAAPLEVTGIRVDAAGRPFITHTADGEGYFVLQRSSTISGVFHPCDAQLGRSPAGELTDTKPPLTAAFYRVERLPLDAPEDLDHDGMDDVYELRRAPALDPLDGTDATKDSDGDLRPNLLEARTGTDPLLPDFFITTSPENHESGVSVYRETQFRFTIPLAEGSVLDTRNLWAEAAGRKLLTRADLSQDRRTASLFFLEPAPGGTQVRTYLDAAGLKDSNGLGLDPDGDGRPGGITAIDFTTSATTPVPETAVIGRVFASELQADPNAPGGFANRPLAGVTITVDGAEETSRTVTGPDGRFTLSPVPAGRFFVHVDGRTVSDPAAGIGWPDLAYYPFVGKAWTAVAGVKTNPAGGSGEIFLPLIPRSALQSVSALAETRITFTPEILAANPGLAGVEITVPPNALYEDGGARGGRVGMAPVPPDRLPEPLPPGLNLPLVITIQTDGAQNFAQPVPAKFPNLPDPSTGRLLMPGAKSALWSFNHDTGRWELAGPMTVSADGHFLTTDPGVGIRQPGWHGCMPGSAGGGGGSGSGPPGNPAPPKPPRPPRPPLQPPAPQPPPAPPDPVDDGLDNDQQGLPEMPKIPDIPGVNEPEDWGDVVSTLVSDFPILGPDIYGDMVRSGDAAIDAADELGDCMDGHPDDGNNNGVPDVVEDFDRWLDTLEDAAGNQLPSVPGTDPDKPWYENADDAADSVKNWWDVWKDLSSKGRSANRLGNAPRLRLAAEISLPSDALIPWAELVREGEEWERLAALQEAADNCFRALLGHDRWNTLADGGVQFREVVPVLLAISQSQQADTEGGAVITAAESAAILSRVAPRVPAAFREEVIARFNRTLSHYQAGIVFVGQAPAGQTDFIDAGTARDAFRRFAAELQTERDAGFTTVNQRGESLLRRMAPALGDFFSAYLDSSALEPASEHQYPVLFEIFAPGSRLRQQFLRTDPRGELPPFFVPSDSTVVVRWLDPVTLRTAVSYFLSGPAGSRIAVPRAVWSERSDPADADADGLSDLGERIVGTLPNNPDSDGDGVTDAAEVRAGSNPLDGIVLQPGIASSADTPGNALDVAVETYDLSPFGGAAGTTRIAVADDAAGGVSLFTLVDTQPTLLGRVDTPGDARRVALPPSGGLVAEEMDVAAVADGPAGLAIVDFTDPQKPRIRHQVDPGTTVRCVTVGNGLAYAGTESGSLLVVDLYSGGILSELPTGHPLHDVRISSGILYLAGTGHGKLLFQSVPLQPNGLPGTPGEPVELDGLVPSRGLRLSVGDELAYLVDGRGYQVLRLANGSVSSVVTTVTGQFGWRHLAPDGTGLGVACVGANSTEDGPHDVSVYDISDPAQPGRFITTIVTPGLASAVVLHAGRAFVADGNSGLQVIDYTAADRGSSRPSGTLSVSPSGPIPSASQVQARVAVRDDVQVIAVELLSNGTVVSRDESWPFEFSLQAPLWSEGAPTWTLDCRVYDGAGNVSPAFPILLNLVQDLAAPRFTGFGVSPDRVIAGPGAALSAVFGEAMDPQSLVPPGLELWDAGADGTLGTSDDTQVPEARTGYLERSYTGVLQFDTLPSGRYRLTVSPEVRDASGNRLGTAVSSDFRVFEADLRAGGTFVAVGTLPGDGIRDEYGILGRAGQTLFFDLQEGAGLGLRLELRHESGTGIFQSLALTDRGEVTLPLDGRYRFALTRVGAMNGAYRMEVSDVPPPQIFPLAIGESVGDGSPAAGAGRIETPGALDLYRFSALPGQRVFFDLVSGPDAGLSWRLTDETGAEVFETAFITDGGTLTLSRGGEYTLALGNPQSDFHGSYGFKLWSVPAEETFAIQIGDTVGNGLPSAGAGNIESPGGFDIYTFDAPPGQPVFFDVLGGASAGLAWRLLDESGTPVFDTSFLGDEGTVTLSRGGTYSLRVGHPQRDFVGTYSFRIWPVPPTQTFGVLIGDFVGEGVPSEGAGRIESPGALDQYTFAASAGQRIFVDLVDGTSAGLAWRLTDDVGNEVFNSAFISNVGTVLLVRGGNYTLTLGHPRRDFTGTYAFKLWNVPPPQEFSIQIGDTVAEGAPTAGAGRIESPGALDVFTFAATAGQRVTFDLISGTHPGLSWRLTDDTGAELFNTAFVTDAGTYTLPRSGTYVLTLGNVLSDFAGTYSFRIVPQP